MRDTTPAGLGRGVSQIYKNLTASVSRGRLSALDRDRMLSRLHGCLEWGPELKEAGAVIEAVFEDIPLKKRVLSEIEQQVSKDCLIASNTSAIPIGELASALKSPERLLGMHYFSPVDKMPLLEIIRTDRTPTEICARAVALGLKQGKVCRL